MVEVAALASTAPSGAHMQPWTFAVVGDADLYGPLGFELAAPKGLESEFEVLNQTLMVVELNPGALAGRAAAG